MKPALLRVAAAVLLVAAFALGWLAFTRFGHDAPPQPGSPSYQDYEAKRVGEARLSMGLGLAASLALFGAFACNSLASQRTTGPPAERP